ncbi:MAG: transketolase [Paracoccaceae bacterium]
MKKSNVTSDLAHKIRISALKMTSEGGSSHIGSVFSIADILGVLYGKFLRVFPDNPRAVARDRFVLSKGHAGAGVYAALAHSGFFDVEELATHYSNGSTLSGHISHKGVPGVEFSTGSLGHGLPVAVGMALALRNTNGNQKVVCLMSDGECGEGSNWEAFLFAGHHKLKNLIAIVDFNNLQSIKTVDETLSLRPFGEKLKSFNWDVYEVDGHDHHAMIEALSLETNERPRVLILNTIKGKGVSFMENNVLWHYRTARGEEYKAALDELSF